MMQLWRVSYARPSPLRSSGALSFVAHALVIGAWAVTTRAPDSLPPDSLANRVYYIPPPNRPPTVRGATETVSYVAFADGIGAGPGPEEVDARQPIRMPERSAAPGPRPAAPDTATEAPGPVTATGDSVFTILEVDTAVVRSQTSAAPAYPLDLLAKHIEGTVIARYVVDTTGFADIASLDVVQSTNAGFVNSVRDALPYMRFSPAKIGQRRVRQLVEQSFTFRIDPAPAAKKKP